MGGTRKLSTAVVVNETATISTDNTSGSLIVCVGCAPVSLLVYFAPSRPPIASGLRGFVVPKKDKSH